VFISRRRFFFTGDICREYKTELENLKQEYNKLLLKVQSSSPMSTTVSTYQTTLSPTILFIQDPKTYKKDKPTNRRIQLQT